MCQGDPGLTWANPADIVYGTALGRDPVERDRERARHVRLRASGRRRSSHAGAAQSLSVTFAPTDGANYTTASKSVRDQCAQGDPRRHLGESADIATAPHSARPSSTPRRQWLARSSTRLRRPRSFRWSRATLSVTFTTTMRRTIRPRSQVGRDQCDQGDAGRHLADACRHRLRPALSATHSTRRPRCPARSSTRRRRPRSLQLERAAPVGHFTRPMRRTIRPRSSRSRSM